MLDRRQHSALWGLCLLLLVFLGHDLACTPEPVQVRLVANQAPETIVTGAPADSSNASHRYHLYWYGADPDGRVVEYAVAVADSNIAPEPSDYHRTVATDSIIEFVANNDVVLAHSFWVFAIDDEGQRDETPARIYFNAVDVNRPVPLITSATKTVGGVADTLVLNDIYPTRALNAQGDTVLSSVRFTWTAFDPDLGGSIQAYRIKLSTENIFTEIPPDSMGVTYTGLPSGQYDFLVEAVDNAGAESLDPATWSWQVNFEPDTEIQFPMVVVDNRGNAEQFDPAPGQVAGEACAWPASVPTFRDSSRVIIFFDGSDLDGTIAGFSYRIFRTDIVRCATRRLPFSGIFPQGWVSLPERADTTNVFFTSNDFEIFVRSHDNEGKTDPTPATVKFHVNFKPDFADPRSAVFPAAGDSVPIGGADSLTVTFTCYDVESPPTVLSYRTELDGRFGQVVEQVSTPDDLRQRWQFPEVGEHSLRYLVSDPGRRADTLEVTFTVVP